MARPTDRARGGQRLPDGVLKRPPLVPVGPARAVRRVGRRLRHFVKRRQRLRRDPALRRVHVPPGRRERRRQDRGALRVDVLAVRPRGAVRVDDRVRDVLRGELLAPKRVAVHRVSVAAPDAEPPGVVIAGTHDQHVRVPVCEFERDRPRGVVRAHLPRRGRRVVCVPRVVDPPRLDEEEKTRLARRQRLERGAGHLRQRRRLDVALGAVHLVRHVRRREETEEARAGRSRRARGRVPAAAAAGRMSRLRRRLSRRSAHRGGVRDERVPLPPRVRDEVQGVRAGAPRDRARVEVPPPAAEEYVQLERVHLLARDLVLVVAVREVARERRGRRVRHARRRHDARALTGELRALEDRARGSVRRGGADAEVADRNLADHVVVGSKPGGVRGGARGGVRHHRVRAPRLAQAHEVRGERAERGGGAQARLAGHRDVPGAHAVRDEEDDGSGAPRRRPVAPRRARRPRGEAHEHAQDERDDERAEAARRGSARGGGGAVSGSGRRRAREEGGTGAGD